MTITRDVQVGELIGYRCWEYKNYYLHSIVYSMEWIPQAIVKSHMPPIPHEPTSYSSGIHCYKNIEYCSEWYNPNIELTKDCPIICGSIWLWGEIIEHQRGYRAQYAKIRSIDEAWYFHEQHPKLLDHLKKRYLPEEQHSIGF